MLGSNTLFIILYIFVQFFNETSSLQVIYIFLTLNHNYRCFSIDKKKKYCTFRKSFNKEKSLLNAITKKLLSNNKLIAQLKCLLKIILKIF